MTNITITARNIQMPILAGLCDFIPNNLISPLSTHIIQWVEFLRGKQIMDN
jgi:hypothetical protein